MSHALVYLALIGAESYEVAIFIIINNLGPCGISSLPVNHIHYGAYYTHIAV
ncbi:hypothetical protein VCHA29O37_640004 [Vibrio chagasii]|nr:hypothetical protein VCHA29O37_640004 [Vibrio chagasii]